jgi:hypothetical protein
MILISATEVDFELNEKTAKWKLERKICKAWLTDGLFSNQKSQFGKNFQGLGLENVPPFWYVAPRKIWQP